MSSYSVVMDLPSNVSEFGRRYLDVVRNALRTLIEFPMPHRSLQLQPRIKITVQPTFVRQLLIPYLGSFIAAYPDIVVKIFMLVPLYDLSLSESDVEVRFGAGRYPNILISSPRNFSKRQLLPSPHLVIYIRLVGLRPRWSDVKQLYYARH